MNWPETPAVSRLPKTIISQVIVAAAGLRCGCGAVASNGQQRGPEGPDATPESGIGQDRDDSGQASPASPSSRRPRAATARPAPGSPCPPMIQARCADAAVCQDL